MKGRTKVTLQEFINKTTDEMMFITDEEPMKIDFDIAVQPEDNGEVHVCSSPSQYSSRIKFTIGLRKS